MAEACESLLDDFERALTTTDDRADESGGRQQVVALSLLTPTQTNRVLSLLTTHYLTPTTTKTGSKTGSTAGPMPTTTDLLFDDALERFALRTDLTDDQSMQLVNILITLITDDAHSITRLGHNATVRHGGVASRLLRIANLTDQALIHALHNPIVAALLTSRSTAGRSHRTLARHILSAAIQSGATIKLALAQTMSLHGDLDLARTVLSRLHDPAEGLTNDEKQRIVLDIVAAVSHPDTPLRDDAYTAWLASCPDTTQDDAIDAFANHIDSLFGFADDSTPDTRQSFAAWASRSDDARLRRHALTHAYHPHQIADAAADPHPLVRATAAAHRLATPTVLAALSTDPDPTVRTVVTHHPATPTDTLAALSTDPHPDVATPATERILAALADTP